jgi:hypothetical protein
MGLPVGQQKHLDKIESSLRASDPRLASLFTIFTRLSQDEAMPALEQLRASATHFWLWMRFRRTAFGRWLGTSAGARVRTALFFPVALAVMACTVLLGGGMPGSHRCSSAARVPGASQLDTKERTKALACSPVLWSRGLTGK